MYESVTIAGTDSKRPYSGCIAPGMRYALHVDI
jgi:hypothetical protein